MKYWLAVIVVTCQATLCHASQVVWGFGGVVTWVGDDNPPLGLDVGLRFSGTIHFDTEPVGSTLFSPSYQSFAWQGASIGTRLHVAGVDFSTVSRPDAFLGMTVGNNRFVHSMFGVHYGRHTDVLFIKADSDPYSSPPPPPGEPGIDSVGSLRNTFFEFQDFDQTVFSDVSFPRMPFDVDQMEVRRISVNVAFDGGQIPYVFYGDIDELYLIPEPATFLLIVIGGPVSFRCAGRTRRI